MVQKEYKKFKFYIEMTAPKETTWSEIASRLSIATEEFDSPSCIMVNPDKNVKRV